MEHMIEPKVPPRRRSGQTPEKGRSWGSKASAKSRSPLRNNSVDTNEDETPTKTVRRGLRAKREHALKSIATNPDEHDDEALVEKRATLVRSPNTTVPPSPLQSGGSNSMLQRFLPMNNSSKTRSKTNISGEGSTVSRMTDEDIELDTTSSSGGPVLRKHSKSPTAGLPAGLSVTSPAGGFGAFLRRCSGDGPGSILRRRGSRDSAELEQPECNMDNNDYEMILEAMQRRADDFHKQGQLDEAISKWLECLAFAEDHQDSLARKTEFRCILVDLHLQASHHHYDNAGGERLSAVCEEATAKHHRESAERHLHQIKPTMVKPSYWSCSMDLFDFLVEDQCWELALLVAARLVDQLEMDGPGPDQFATVHFQIASLKLDSNRQGEALHHLQATVKYMQMIDAGRRDMEMYLQVLELLASEYNAQGQSDLALDTYRESLKGAPIEKHASLYCRMARVHLDSKRLDKALELLEAAASSLDYAEPSIRLELLQTKGDVYCRLGLMDESIQVYQSALDEVVNPAEKAKLLYTLGRLCARVKHVRLAISYFTMEMEITEVELGKKHLSVSRVLHELAKLYDEGLGEPRMALMKLRKALEIEVAVLQECHYCITKCPKCNQIKYRMCTHHAAHQRDVSNQIRETKRLQGRIHFKLGEFERALKTSFDGTERQGYRDRRSSIG